MNSSIIYHQLLDKTYNVSNQIGKTLDSSLNSTGNIYKILIQTPRYLFVFYFFIILIIWRFIHSFEIRLNEILTLFVCIIVLYFLFQKDLYEFTKYKDDKVQQLKFIHALLYDSSYWNEKNSNYTLDIQPAALVRKSYLSYDTLIVQLFYDIREYSQYNMDSYILSIIHSNHVIGLEYETTIGLNREYENYTIAISETKKALNYLSSIIHQLPLSYMTYNKFKKSVELLHQLLNHHLDKMAGIFKNENIQNGLDISKKPSDMYEMYFKISGKDESESTTFHFY